MEEDEKGNLLISVRTALEKAKRPEEIALLEEDLLELFRAERIIVYVIDTLKTELVPLVKVVERSRNKTGKESAEIRMPMNFESVAGFSVSARQTVNIDNAYNRSYLKTVDPRLNFSPSFDRATGFKTKQILSAPIMFGDCIAGVIQVMNKTDDVRFDDDDVSALESIASLIANVFRDFALKHREQND